MTSQEDKTPAEDQSIVTYQTQKCKYSTEKLMMMLDREKLEALEEEFLEHPDGIELPNFVWLMKCAMSVDVKDKAELILGLWQLFNEIDINGDEHMEWSEFTQYIIDTVMGENENGQQDNRVGELTVAEILDHAKSHNQRRYQLAPIFDRTLHAGSVRYMRYVEHLDLISVVEMGSKTVKFYDTNCEVKYVIAPTYTDKNFVLSAGYHEESKTMLISGSDRSLCVYTEDQYGEYKLMNSFKSKVTNPGVWFFEKHEAWVTVGSDRRLRRWDIHEGKELMMYGAGHKETVMDAIEIKFPLCIATAGLDGSIFIWDLGQELHSRRLYGRHNKGVRSLDYSPDHGGNLLSVGYEKHINVWSPGISLSDQCYTGRLEGHNWPVVQWKFFQGRPTCASVDEKGNVRLWDVRTFSCFQIITHDRGKLEVTKLVTITKHEKFVVGGKRLFWFEMIKDITQQKDDEDVIPIHAGLNSYYLNILVVTKFDVRLYDACTGKLQKIFTEVQDKEIQAELSSFTFDYRFRKFVLGDNAGGIRVYNWSNGALMNTVEPCRISQVTDDKSYEISDLNYVKSDQVLISSSWDTNLYVHDQEDPESTPLLRLCSGGHQDSDITWCTCSEHLSLMASGSTNGIITVWDFELGKLDAALIAHHDREIWDLEFVDKHPLLISSAQDHVICVWGVRPLLGKKKYNCLLRISSKSFFKNREMTSTILKMTVVAEDQPEIQVVPRRKIVKKEVFKERADRRRTVIMGSNASPIRSKLPSQTVYLKSTNPPSRDSIPLATTVKFQAEFCSPAHTGRATVLTEDQDLGDYDVVDVPEDEIPVASEEVSMRKYLYMGDDRGWIKIWDLERIAEILEIPECASQRDAASFNAKRRDNKNATNDLIYWLLHWEGINRDRQLVPRTDHVVNEVHVKEIKGHSEAITSIEMIEDPQSLITCSLDKTVKIWSRSLTLWGCINLLSNEEPQDWYFPYNWEKKRQDDVKQVVEVMKKIDEMDVDFDPNNMKLQYQQAVKHVRKVRQDNVGLVTQKKEEPGPEEKKQDVGKNQNAGRQFEEEDWWKDELPLNQQFQFYMNKGQHLSKAFDRVDAGNARRAKVALQEGEGKQQYNRRVTKKHNVKINESISSETKWGARSGSIPSMISATSSSKLLKANEDKLPEIQSKVGAGKPALAHKRDQLSHSFVRKTHIQGKAAIQARLNKKFLASHKKSVSAAKLSSYKRMVKTNAPMDIRFAIGEASRTLNNSLSNQSLKQACKIDPYTTDISMIRNKYKLNKTLSEDMLKRRGAKN